MTNFGWKVEATQKGKGAWIQAQYTKAISLVGAIFIGLIGRRLYLRGDPFTLNMVYNGRRKMSLVPACRKLPKKSLVPAFNF